MRPERTELTRDPAYHQRPPKGDFMNAVPVLTTTNECSRCYWKGVHDIMLLKRSSNISNVTNSTYIVAQVTLLVKNKRRLSMATTKKRIAAYVTDETVKKYKIVAATRNTSMSEYTEQLIMKAIEGYEVEHGEIKVQE